MAKNAALNCTQITPAHADHISGYDITNKKGINKIDEMFKNEYVVGQIKHDGERMKMHFCLDESTNETYVVMDSRRISKATGMYKQCQDNFPQFNNIVLTDSLGTKMRETVLDGELKAVRNGKDNWADAVGVIHSLEDRAVDLMNKNEFTIKYMVFDCVMVDGMDVRDKKYEDRLGYARYIVARLKQLYPTCNIELTETTLLATKEDAYKMRDKAIEDGYEGIVIKSLARAYDDKGAYIKLKKFETKDLVVYGYDEGNGKYVGTVGALKIGYYDKELDRVIHVTDCNCGTDDDRAMWKKGLDDGSLYRAVIEVKCQEITDKSLRHPVFVRIRTDKDYKMCTKDTIFEKGDQ